MASASSPSPSTSWPISWSCSTLLWAGVGRRRAGPEGDLLHEALRVLVPQPVVGRPHRLVPVVAQPGIDHALRDSLVYDERFDEVPQGMERKALLPPSWQIQCGQDGQEPLVQLLDVQGPAGLSIRL